MKIAIMQPYFAPYLGYFQLIKEVDLFIFYDDVNFITRGWINRNYITINNDLKKFTIPLKKPSQNKLINEIEVNWDCKEMKKLIKTFEYNLKNKPKANYIINKVIESKPTTISDMAILSITLICKELGIKTKFEKSSNLNYTKTKDKVLNLVEICKENGFSNYVNAEGGQKIYTKKEFSDHGINLQFLKGTSTPSLLEIMDKIDIKDELKKYELL
jgi:hypothetical protein